MQPEKLETVRIGYKRRWFAIGSAACAAIVVAAAYLAATAVEDFTSTFWLIVAAAVLALLLAFPLPCIFTHHVAGERMLRLRMGLIMKVDIPYLAMREISRRDLSRGFLSVGIGVRFKQKTGTVYVLSSFENTVALKLKEELKLRAWRPPVHEIILSVEDAEATIDLLSSRIASTGG
ncbi:MAG: hypothetical protein JSU93_04600 [Methanobacteriota archaeon]|nr:MAG: hypothetical protein JSU93_04600 [Euryarchaeota archaeon]